MPRGGYRGKSIMDDSNVLATKDELTALTANMKKNFIADISRPKIDLHDTEQVKGAILNYLTDCEQSGKRPLNLGLYRALDLTRQDVNALFNGRTPNKASPECIDIVKKAVSMLGEYREQLGAQGKLNPVTMIFWQKNYDGLEDNTKVEITAQTGPQASLSPDEIARQIEKDIPLDADFRETE